jgi:hypothetical protein
MIKTRMGMLRCCGSPIAKLIGSIRNVELKEATTRKTNPSGSLNHQPVREIESNY